MSEGGKEEEVGSNRGLHTKTSCGFALARAASTARRAMAPTESGGAAAIRAAAGDLALAYAWTVVCFRAWDDALER